MCKTIVIIVGNTENLVISEHKINIYSIHIYKYLFELGIFVYKPTNVMCFITFNIYFKHKN